jgi:hypothetical protein
MDTSRFICIQSFSRTRWYPRSSEGFWSTWGAPSIRACTILNARMPTTMAFVRTRLAHFAAWNMTAMRYPGGQFRFRLPLGGDRHLAPRAQNNRPTVRRTGVAKHRAQSLWETDEYIKQCGQMVGRP